MATYSVVTSFSPNGYEVYGRRFVESFLKFWPADVSLTVVGEGDRYDDLPERVIYRDLLQDPDWVMFYARHWDRPKAQSYRHEAVKFARKVFAYTATPFNADYLIWIDGDVETFAPVTDEFLAAVCRPDICASYLGRKDWDHSELGWCAWSRVASGPVFLRDIRRMYSTDEIFDLPQTHDSYVWDRVRERYEKGGLKFLNLSANATGLDVWDQSPLGQVMKHAKGMKAKMDTYGRAA